MYFNVDGLKPVTSESSLDELYIERNRIDKLIEEKEKEVYDLQNRMHKIKHGAGKEIVKNKFAEDKNWIVIKDRGYCCHHHAPTISWIKEN